MKQKDERLAALKAAKALWDKEASHTASLNAVAFYQEVSILYDVSPLSPKPGAVAEDLLSALYPADARIVVSTDLRNMRLLTCGDFDLQVRESMRGVYFKVNALTRDPSGFKGGVCDSDCGLDYVMLEMDKTPLKDQSLLWSSLIAAGLPVVSLVHSGGKSLHAILRLNAADSDDYAQRAVALLRLIANFIPDTTSINRSRYTRLPGCIRAEKERAMQSLYYLRGDAPPWTPDLPCNDIIGSLTKDLLPPPSRVLIEGTDPYTPGGGKRPEAETKAIQKWVRENPFHGDLNVGDLISSLGWSPHPKQEEEAAWKHFVRCPWHARHTNAGMSDGAKDAYVYEWKSKSEFRYAFHCSHETCLLSRDNITHFFEEVKENHPEELKDAIQPWPDVTSEFATLPDEDELSPAPVEAEEAPTVTDSGTLLHQPVSEWNNALLFESLHGKTVRYLQDEELWVLWEGKRWRDDDREIIRERAKDVTRLRLKNAASDDIAEDARRYGSATAIDGLVKNVRSIPAISSSSEDFDLDPWLLGNTNGILDLRTGKLRPAKTDDMIRSQTKVAYKPDALCPRWLQHLRETHPNTPEVARFLQVWFGYTLTGMVSEEKILIFYGSGKNGKSTIVDTIHEMLGSYAGVAAKSLLLANPKGEDPKAATPALVDLKGRRMVTLSETDVDAKVSESSIKEVTKGEPITARKLHGNNITFRSKAKIILSSNHRPKVYGTDEGIWRRLVLIYFGENFEGREDHTLKEVITSEAEGILAWAVQGSLIWQEEGLVIPECIRKDTAEYRREEDLLSMFLEENTVKEAGARSCRKELYARYVSWVHDSGLRPFARPNFNRKLIDKGINSVKIHGFEHWVGFSLKEEVLS